MTELTGKEIARLSEEIERGGITYSELQEELLDHLCCDIEVKMEDGKAFLEALNEVKFEMGTDGLKQVQEDTLILTNQKYRAMKKLMYVLGIFAPVLVIVGTIFKIQHWPGASIMLTVGLFLLAMIYLPLFVSVRIRDNRDEGKKVNRASYIIGMICGIIFIVGALFKIQHWPGASIMISLSGLVTVAVFIPYLIYDAIRDRQNQVQKFTVLIFVLSFIAILFMSFALRVSKSVLDAFILAANDNIETTAILSENNAEMVTGLALSDNPQHEGFDQLINQSGQLRDYISGTMRVLVIEGHRDNIDAIGESGEIDFTSVLNKDNPEIPAKVMMGIDYPEARGAVLRDMLTDYRTKIIALNDSNLTLLAEKLLDTSAPNGEPGITASWISHNFEHVPLMSALTQLTHIELNIALVESELIRYISREIDTGHSE